jgi:hypothetical protein
MSLPTMHHTDSKALPILQFTALHAVVRQRTLEIELEESPELLSEALFERCAPAPFWSEGGAKLCWQRQLHRRRASPQQKCSLPSLRMCACP